jgi:flagellar biosynthesis/type III secretory pathway protein FliH
MEDARPYMLQPFEDEAQAELARAREMVRAAMEERDRIREEARREGLERGRAEASSAELLQARDLLRRAAEELRAKSVEVAAAAERDLVRLALAIAGKIVKREVAAGGVAPANVRRAVELLAGRRSVVIRIHPDDLSAIEAVIPDLRREFADLREVAIEGSDAVGRGGCIVATREGSVDATIAAQLEDLERGLLG